MSSEEVRDSFMEWLKGDTCPWYIREQYLDDNAASRRGGAGVSSKQKTALELTGSTYNSKLEEAADEWNAGDDWEWPAGDTEDEEAGGEDEKVHDVNFFVLHIE